MAIQTNFPALRPSLLLDFANSRQLDPRITFTRTTTATYYDGVTTTKAEENLYAYSQTFTTWWTALNVSLTANATTAPDGTNTATLMYPSSTGGESIIYAPAFATTQTHTLSCYAKASGKSYLMLEITASTLARTAWFNLSNGTVGTVGGSISSSSITSVGNGWYRCVITFTLSDSIRGNIGLSDSDGSYSVTASGTNGIYIWGAQLEQRSSATAYTATTTQAITNYIPVLQTAAAGVARFDHNPTTGESLGLLIEEARTNLATYSADFSNAAWTKSGGSITSNGNVAPDGTISADIFVENTSNSTHEIGQAFTINMTSTAYTLSIYVKANGRTRGSLLMVAPGPTYQQFGCNFNLTAQTATVTSANGGVVSSATITPVGNDWYRITATGYTTYNGSQTFAFYLQDSSGNVIYTGNGFSGMSVWGAQLEAGSFATSYIPTTSASVTRNADAASMTGTNFSSWFNNAQGTLYAEQYITNVTAGSVNNQPAACLYKDSSNFIATGQGVGDSGGTGQRSFVWVQHNNSTQVFAGTGNFITVGLTLKNAVAYETNNFAYSANTQTPITDTSGTVPAVNSLSIGFYLIGINYYANNPIRKIAFYPVRVTNAQLQALTS